MARKKTVKLKVVTILKVFPLGKHWWARVDAMGPQGITTMELGFETEKDARNCIGLSFKSVQSS